jgi:hypothetical protein
MFWAMVAVAIAGLVLGITCTVHVMVLGSVVAVALTAIVAFQTGLSVPMGIVAIGSALVILQACYLVGAFIGAGLRSAKHDASATRASR